MNLKFRLQKNSNEKIGAAVGTITGLAMLAASIFASVHMATHYSMYHGNWGIDRITHLKVWRPDALNGLAAGSTIGQIFGYMLGTITVIGSVVCFTNNYKEAKKRPLVTSQLVQ
ncbi:MAG: hypothetical protein JSR97_04700 [Verrucomicrobia bacterium]|nr:hypothetical protein [Verrucomicrobiota bacterium]